MVSRIEMTAFVVIVVALAAWYVYARIDDDSRRAGLDDDSERARLYRAETTGQRRGVATVLAIAVAAVLVSIIASEMTDDGSEGRDGWGGGGETFWAKRPVRCHVGQMGGAGGAVDYATLNDYAEGGDESDESDYGGADSLASRRKIERRMLRSGGGLRSSTRIYPSDSLRRSQDVDADLDAASSRYPDESVASCRRENREMRQRLRSCETSLDTYGWQLRDKFAKFLDENLGGDGVGEGEIDYDESTDEED